VLAFITEAGAKSVVMTDGSSDALMKKASTTRGRPVRFVPSGQDGTAGPVSSCIDRLAGDDPVYHVAAAARPP
jgi:hypothetical protein